MSYTQKALEMVKNSATSLVKHPIRTGLTLTGAVTGSARAKRSNHKSDTEPLLE